MGQEIADTRFTPEDFAEFERRLAAETAFLRELAAKGGLRSSTRKIGFELEGWLVDQECRAAPRNAEFIERLNDPLVVPELATFNFELNAPPAELREGVFQDLHKGLLKHWSACESVAQELGMQVAMTGILPTLQESDLCLDNMSLMQRYRALNDQIFRLREGKPIELDIKGEEQLSLWHQDVMLEAATTSFQLHFQVDHEDAVRAFNISKILSAALVAATSNSPLLFERLLWAETRIPVFEQAVSVGGTEHTKRVSYGIRYADQDIQECFDANLDRYPVLLPELMEGEVSEMRHLRLHNGTIWRWNRPLVGFDEVGDAHLRIEQRVIPAGPTARDAIANAAFYFGLMTYFLDGQENLEQEVVFSASKQNFYLAACDGLEAQQKWRKGLRLPLKEIILEDLWPRAIKGLLMAGVPSGEAEYWLGVIRERVDSGRTGAAWQRQWVKSHENTCCDMLKEYLKFQRSDMPVHTWPL